MAYRGARAGLLAVFCVVAFVTTAAAAADEVPLPTPAPRAKTGAVAPSPAATSPSNSPAAAAAASAPAVSKPTNFFPFSFSLGKPANPSQATAFDANQRKLLGKVSTYLSGVQTMVGDFVQVGPDGRRVDGTFAIQKPGKVRFQYKPPSPIDIIADGSAVVVRDRSLETTDNYPLSQTPLRYLLADRIDLLRDTDVVSVSADDTFITVVVEETQVMVGTSKLMMMFDAKTVALKQWTVTDPQGLDTTVAVYNIDTTKKPDPNLFVINYTSNLKP
jgi:outer membrane lipoprotein-sorting protein